MILLLSMIHNNWICSCLDPTTVLSLENYFDHLIR